MAGLASSVIAFIAIVAAAVLGAPRDTSVTSIAQTAALPQVNGAPVTLRATLTLNGNPAYIQDSTGGAAVEGLTAQGFRIGDELLITGTANETEAGLVLKRSRAELLWHGTPVPPLSVTADEAALGKFAGLLIEVNGDLVGTEKHGQETWLRLWSGHQQFLARLASGQGNSLLPKMKIGSILRLRGICSVLPRDTRYQGGFAVLLRSGEDVSVISGPPWWNVTHLLEMTVLLVVLIATGHIMLVQMLKARFRAIMAERARLGHEPHDTLAQTFAGLSYQIQAARKIVPQTNDKLSRHLDLALDMVRHSHSEAHRSIMMLRPQALAEGAELHSAIQAALEQSTNDCQLDVRFTTRGSPARLSLATTDTLYRVTQEAIANALRHGHPSLLEVSLEYTPVNVRLSVSDNGDGFEMAVRTHGFGLAGMRERVRAVRGTFSVESEPGKGTRVRVEIHIRQGVVERLISAFRQWFSNYSGRLQRMFRNKRQASSW